MNVAENFSGEHKTKLDYLCIAVGQACNLKCRDCGNFAPFAPKDMLRYDVEKIINDLKTVTKYADIRMLQIQGGEPFLYPQLETLLDFVRNCREIEMCLIATNGTVMPKVRAESLQGEKFLVRISHYPVASDISSEVQEWLESNSVRYKIYRFVSAEDKWFDLGKQCNPKEDIQTRFEKCLFKNCFTLENGMIERCARALVAQRLQGFTAKKSGGGHNGDGDYLPVYDSEDFKEALEKYISVPRAMEACRYCNGTDGTVQVEPAVQLKENERWEDVQ